MKRRAASSSAFSASTGPRAGGAGAGEEVEHDVALAGGCTDKIADQAEQLGEAEHLFAEVASISAVATPWRSLRRKLTSASDAVSLRPAIQLPTGRVAAFMLGSLADDAREAPVRDRLADPEIEVGQPDHPSSGRPLPSRGTAPAVIAASKEI